MGTPITRRRAYGPMRKVDDQNTKPEQKKETKKPKQDPLFGKDAKGNPKITKKGSKKLEQGLDAARKEADRDHDKFMNDMFGDCF